MLVVLLASPVSSCLPLCKSRQDKTRHGNGGVHACCVVLCIRAGEVIQLKADPGATFSIAELKQAVKEHKPAILFLVQVSHSCWPHGSVINSTGAVVVQGTLHYCLRGVQQDRPC